MNRRTKRKKERYSKTTGQKVGKEVKNELSMPLYVGKTLKKGKRGELKFFGR